MSRLTYTRKVVALVSFTFIIRCFLAYTIQLGNDATYYYTYALQPDWNHFDHPPLVGIFIRIFTLDLHWVNDLSMRLPSIASAAICTWLIYKCGKLLKNERAGWIAAILYNTSIYTSFAAGFFILPDSTQLVFWLMAVYLILDIVIVSSSDRLINAKLLLLGIVIGMATMCKVHSLFLWLGVGAYILFHDRKYLKNPYLYVSIILTLIIISPIYFWNVQNDFVTWRFHSERVDIGKSQMDLVSFLQTIFFGFFYFSPPNIIIYIITFFHLKNTSFPRKPLRVLLWLAFPIILVTLFLSFFRTILVHWTGPGHIALMILSGYVVDEHLNKTNKSYRIWLRLAVAWICVFVIIGIGVTNHNPSTLETNNPIELGKDDVTLERYGWNYLKDEFDKLRQKEIQAGRMEKSSPIVITRWYPGCHYLYYVGRPLDIPVIGVGSIYEVHKFAWLNRIQGYVNEGENGYFISTSNHYEDPQELLSNDFRNIELIKTIPLKRSGVIVRYWYIYRLESAVRQLGNFWPEE